jgi:hypothetical protein
MGLNIGKELAALQRLTVNDLRRRYADLFGEPTRTGNRAWLVKRVLWRMQALAEGDLSERARRRAAELANDADLRLNPPKMRAHGNGPDETAVGTLRFQSDHRLPPPGTVITRTYKGLALHVKVLPEGFEHEGTVYRSLSAVAKAVTGSHCNGFLFFRLRQPGEVR